MPSRSRLPNRLCRLSATFSDRCHIAVLAFCLSAFLPFCLSAFLPFWHIAVLALCFSVKSPFGMLACWLSGYVRSLAVAVSLRLTLAAQTRSGCSALPRFAQARSGLLNAAQVIAGCSHALPALGDLTVLAFPAALEAPATMAVLATMEVPAAPSLRTLRTLRTGLTVPPILPILPVCQNPAEY